MDQVTATIKSKKNPGGDGLEYDVSLPCGQTWTIARDPGDRSWYLVGAKPGENILGYTKKEAIEFLVKAHMESVHHTSEGKHA